MYKHSDVQDLHSTKLKKNACCIRVISIYTMRQMAHLFDKASFSAHVKVYIFKRNYDAGKPAQALTVVTPIKQPAVLKRSLFS